MSALFPAARRLPLIALVLVCALASLALAADQADIVGTWEHKDATTGETITIVLQADGAGKLDDERIRYTVTGDKIRIRLSDETLDYTFKIDGDTMTVSGGDLEAPTTFRRQGATPKRGLGARLKGAGDAAAAAAPKPADGAGDNGKEAIAGRWEFKNQDQTFTMVVNADGTGTFNAAPMQWTLKDDQFSTTVGGQSRTYRVKLDAQTLSLTNENGQTVTFRKPANEANAAGPLDALAGVAAPQATSGIVGTWKADDGTILEMTADGRFIFGGRSASYTAADGKLTFRGPAGEISWPYRLDGDKLVITMNGVPQTLTRISDAPAHGAGAAPGVTGAAAAGGGLVGVRTGTLVGNWLSSEGLVQIRDDGSASMGGQQVRWTSDATMIHLQDGQQWAKVPYKLDGDKLTLGTGPTQTLVRIKGVEGVWVGSEASVDPTVVMSITQYLTLYSDGTVGFSKSELGATRQQVTEHTERFMSSWQQQGQKGRTYGRWQANGNTITIQWEGAFGNRTTQGQFDLKTNKMVLQGLGILQEGANVTFERQ